MSEIKNVMPMAAEDFEKFLQSSANKSSIINFYAGRSIFVTGATGFLGTVLIEKLLYTCKDIKLVYVLIKPRDGETIEKRLEKLTESMAFKRIRDYRSDSLKKIVPICGDLLENNLGLTEKDFGLLQKEVSVVFHGAASLSFGMSVADAVNVNTKGTERMINICKQMRHLTAFVYISSAYSNSNKLIIDEKVYKTEVSIDKVYELIDIPKSKKIAENLLNGQNNTYAYSKALSEELIDSKSHEIPAVIVRPTIILSAVRDPLPGWLSGWMGIIVLTDAACKGLWTCWNSEPSNILDVVPVDYVANCLIAAAWDKHKRRVKEDKEVKVFNYCSGVQNPIELGPYMWTCLEHNRKLFGKQGITNRIYVFRKNYVNYRITRMCLQIIPTIILFFMDLVYWLLGYKQRMLKILKYYDKTRLAVEYFTQKHFLFLNDNVRRLHQSMSDIDRNLFDFDISNVQWNSYLRDHVIGIKNMWQYNVKE